MAITFQSASTAAAGSSTATLACNYPASIGAGDLLIAVFTAGNVSATINSEPAWTPVDSADSGNRKLRVYYRVADGSETGSISWTLSANNRMAAAILRYTVGGTPSKSVSANATGSSAGASAPNLTGAAANTLILWVIHAAANSGTITSPATERVNVSDGSAGNQPYLAVSESFSAGGGSVSGGNFTWASSVAWMGVSAAFQEAAGGVAKPVLFRSHYVNQGWG